jgi:hypothetical protein
MAARTGTGMFPRAVMNPFPREIGNAFSAMLNRNRIELEQALQAIAAYRQIPIRYVEGELEDTLAIAERYAIYAYDAYLIRCGLEFSAPLLSLDRGLLQCLAGGSTPFPARAGAAALPTRHRARLGRECTIEGSRTDCRALRRLRRRAQ